MIDSKIETEKMFRVLLWYFIQGYKNLVNINRLLQILNVLENEYIIKNKK